MITFSDATPDWMKDWVTWSVNLVASDWELTVDVKDVVDADIPECPGEIDIENGYLRAKVIYCSGLKNNRSGHIAVVHEICHLLMERMVESAEALISSKTVKNTAWKTFNHNEEETIVKLSRILVGLRIDEKP